MSNVIVLFTKWRGRGGEREIESERDVNFDFSDKDLLISHEHYGTHDQDQMTQVGNSLFLSLSDIAQAIL